MSSLSIASYFPFARVKVTTQNVSAKADLAVIDIKPDKRFKPICYVCKTGASGIHSEDVRQVRDLDFASAKVFLRCWYRSIYCPQCNSVVVEDLELFVPYQRVTRRLAGYIHDLCKKMTITDVANHFDLNWKTVKKIDKLFLEKEYGETDYNNLRLLAVDEIALKKGHKYMTVVIDYVTGRVIWMGKGRTANTLKAFFDGMTAKQKEKLEAIVMDMWDPFIKATKEAVPHLKIVFDLFHVVSAFNKVIDKVRNSEYNKASEEDKEVIKGSKYLLLKNRVRKKKEREHLQLLLDLNETITTVMILRDKLKMIWKYKYRAWANKTLDEWCALAEIVDHPEIVKFAKMLKRHRDGILNHCEFPIHTSKLEGINNKIKVIKRDAYGYHDEIYFTLKVKQAFDPISTN